MRHPRFPRFLALALAALLLCGLGAFAFAKDQTIQISAAQYPVAQEGKYASLEEVAVYLYAFGQLPSNFITKRQAMDLGWDSRKGNLDQVAPGCSIGGDHFGNYEKNPDLPAGQQWTECDIDADGGFRGAQRLVFTRDGLLYYSDDHYNHFTQVLIQQDDGVQAPPEAPAPTEIQEDGAYTSKEDVAAFIQQFAMLPYNYYTKAEAKALGWTAQKDNLGSLAPGYAIGGDPFGNREQRLPKAKGRVWWECDVNVADGKRSRERLVFSNDGLIFFSQDNYQSFEQLY